MTFADWLFLSGQNRMKSTSSIPGQPCCEGNVTIFEKSDKKMSPEKPHRSFPSTTSPPYVEKAVELSFGPQTAP
jgi:hypothetical protein